jgi:hypothetical protein
MKGSLSLAHHIATKRPLERCCTGHMLFWSNWAVFVGGRRVWGRFGTLLQLGPGLSLGPLFSQHSLMRDWSLWRVTPADEAAPAAWRCSPRSAAKATQSRRREPIDKNRRTAARYRWGIETISNRYFSPRFGQPISAVADPLRIVT